MGINNNEPKVYISPSLRKTSENNSFFHKPGSYDLNNSPVSSFHTPNSNDLTGNYTPKSNQQNIDTYLSSIASGKKVGYSSDFSSYGCVRTIVGLEQLKDMVNRGCNIIFAKRIGDFFEVEFEEYELKNEEVKGRAR